MARTLPYALGALCLIAASAASAQEAGASLEDTAAARALFAEGLELSDAGAWEEAADRFSRALALRASPTVAYNLGVALERLGRLTEAVEAFRMALRDETAAIHAQAESGLHELEPRIGRLTIRVEGDPIEVVLDDRALDAAHLGVALPADPGEHRVEGRRDGESIVEERVTLEEGQAATVVLRAPAVSLDAESVARAALETPAVGDDVTRSPSDGATSDDTPWIVLGVVVAIVVLAGIGIAVGVAMTAGDQPTGGDFEPGILEL